MIRHYGLIQMSKGVMQCNYKVSVKRNNIADCNSTFAYKRRATQQLRPRALSQREMKVLFVFVNIQDGADGFKAGTDCNSAESFDTNGGAHVLSLGVHCNG